MPIDPREENVMQEVERKPYSSESMRVRCPHCRKLYLVQFTDVKEAKPRFECVQCHSRFWLSLPDMDLSSEMIGLPLQVKEIPASRPKREDGQSSPQPLPAKIQETQPCPKCFKAIAVGARECVHCGVILAKLKELNFTELGPPHSEGLGRAWSQVLEAYAEDSVHAKFIRLAESENNLVYAGAQYSQMLKLMPTDDTSQKRLREIQALALVQIPNVNKGDGKRLYARIWQIPLVIACMMIIVGMVLPVFRNIVGVGAALLFIALALQIQMRKRH